MVVCTFEQVSLIRVLILSLLDRNLSGLGLLRPLIQGPQEFAVVFARIHGYHHQKAMRVMETVDGMVEAEALDPHPSDRRALSLSLAVDLGANPVAVYGKVRLFHDLEHLFLFSGHKFLEEGIYVFSKSVLYNLKLVLKSVIELRLYAPEICLNVATILGISYFCLLEQKCNLAQSQ